MVKAEKKTYQIANESFALKELTLKEAEAVNKIMQSVTVGSGELEISANLDNNSAREFLSLVLAPKEEPSFFDNATEEQFLEVFKDFFLTRLKQKRNLETFFSGLIPKRK